MKWLLIPGWSTDTEIFSHYLDLLNENTTYSWGFSTDSQASKDEETLSFLNEDYSVLCYSMGILKALELSIQNPPKKIISICGFPSFCNSDKRRTMQINLMIRGLKKNHQKVITDFRKTAGLSDVENKTWNVNNLAKGLVNLRDSDFSDSSETRKLDILLIEGIQDAIVPNNISQRLLTGPGNRQSISVEGGHGIIESQINEIRQILKDNI